MSLPAAQLLFGFCFVCIRPILTNLFSVEHFCPLTIRVNRSLISANLAGNDIGDAGAAALSDALKTNSTLETLELRSNEVGAAAARSLAGMLQVNRSLTSVNLLKNSLGDGAAAVVAAAKQQGNIKTLCGTKDGQTEIDLGGNSLKAPDAVLLSFDLEFNRALKSANLASNGKN